MECDGRGIAGCVKDGLRRTVSMLWLAGLALIGILAASCVDEPLAPPPIEFPATNVSFNAHVKPLMQSNCAISGCHDGANSDNHFVGLESYAQVLASGIVSPGRPDQSRLAQVLRGMLSHPNDDLFTSITSAQREGIIQWIREGALDN